MLLMYVGLMTIGCHTGSDDMDVVVASVVVSIDQQRLSLFRISHLFEVSVCNVKQLLMGVLISLATDSHMELSIPDIRVSC